VIDLATVKGYLRVTHTSDDTLLQTLLDGAETEALRFMNRDELPGAYDLPEDSSSEPEVSEAQVPADVVVAVFLLVMAEYEADAEDRDRLRKAAEVKLTPYRTEMGC
jgi:hypothetical protein